jgi:hypothetical protein
VSLLPSFVSAPLPLNLPDRAPGNVPDRGQLTGHFEGSYRTFGEFSFKSDEFNRMLGFVSRKRVAAWKNHGCQK